VIAFTASTATIAAAQLSGTCFGTSVLTPTIRAAVEGSSHPPGWRGSLILESPLIRTAPAVRTYVDSLGRLVITNNPRHVRPPTPTPHCEKPADANFDGDCGPTLPVYVDYYGTPYTPARAFLHETTGYSYSSTYLASPAVMTTSAAPPAPPPLPPPAPIDLTTLAPPERAAALWKMARRADAMATLREHLATPAAPQADGVRTLAIMSMHENAVADAIALVRLAYRLDPTLAHRTFDAAALDISPSRLRQMIVRAADDANRDKSASAWLLLAVLMQAEDRREPALAMIKKSAAAGLEQSISEPLIQVLAPKASPKSTPRSAPTAPSGTTRDQQTTPAKPAPATSAPTTQPELTK